ncbi:SCF E2 ubiquitin-protein ligase catalytic subunit CDC34 KNAG_0H01040 [Huiozyma naganishii CBS 8797]|uniref:UBC core domain-containing protein n=1 Tax=Huiozyma naganishii (strain ATCC MYA-139 / BCRC 22969 / CBS 8797 / KCTC 17520 / NBRC 10181 / NCYC 3082 / Yp74L-3) TaxID=1071383 RepID=J7RPB9_HUIN7|nr:hypothetical protein KNAG_0H01040 [Kazachstania naganishii CBS 8797]CCK71518.1 hypothetical protein KNAG_0H01040 [Kazachstania naganishii CBS 8797]
MSGRKSTAASLLLRQYRELTDPRKCIPSFNIELEDDSNIFVWNVGVMVLNEDSLYHGGYFKAQMRFPEDFPFSPPQFRFTPAIYHPNVYRDGRLCISILHQSGDPMTDEPDAETWSPVQTVESVLISIVSLLEDPNISSPANVDAAVDYRKNPDQYRQRVLMEVERSKQDIPQGFQMPTASGAYLSSNDSVVAEPNATTVGGGKSQQQQQQQQHQNTLQGNSSTHNISENFWYDSDEDDDDAGGLFDEEEGDAEMIEFEDDDDDDDDSIDNDSVMDRKQPIKADDESEDVDDDMGK